jgi:uncharacterized protein YxjI
MRFLIRQRIFSLTDSFTIKDELQNDRYLVRGSFFSLGDKLRIYDLLGNELVYIEQKLFRLMPEYEIYLAGKLAGRVKKKFTLFSHRFEIESELGNYTVEGDFFGLDFTIRKNNYPAAVVSKKFFSLSDTYGVEIGEQENEVFMLALVIVIDQTIHDNKNR